MLLGKRRHGNSNLDKLSPQKESVATLPVKKKHRQVGKTNPFWLSFCFSLGNMEIQIVQLLVNPESMWKNSAKKTSERCPQTYNPDANSLASRFITYPPNLPNRSNCRCLTPRSCFFKHVLQCRVVGESTFFVFLVNSPRKMEKPHWRFLFTLFALEIGGSDLVRLRSFNFFYQKLVIIQERKHTKSIKLTWIFQFTATRC